MTRIRAVAADDPAKNATMSRVDTETGEISEAHFALEPDPPPGTVPEAYFATTVLFDPPCGEFRDDFSVVPDSDYEREMPGKRAREALDKLRPTLEAEEAAKAAP